MSQEQFAVIRMPVETARTLERVKLKEKRAERARQIQNARKGDCTVSMIMYSHGCTHSVSFLK